MVNVMSAKLLLLKLNWLPVNEAIKCILLDVYTIYLKCFHLLDGVYFTIKITSLR